MEVLQKTMKKIIPLLFVTIRLFSMDQDDLTQQIVLLQQNEPQQQREPGSEKIIEQLKKENGEQLQKLQQQAGIQLQLQQQLRQLQSGLQDNGQELQRANGQLQKQLKLQNGLLLKEAKKSVIWSVLGFFGGCVTAVWGARNLLYGDGENLKRDATITAAGAAFATGSVISGVTSYKTRNKFLLIAKSKKNIRLVEK